VEHAYELDKINGNDFWRKSIKKEMTNVGIAFQILDDSEPLPYGFTRVTGHVIFDVEMSLEQKSRWVVDGHLTKDPESISTYTGVLSRDSERIALTCVALNGIDIWACDIRNAYIQAPS
jgi:hypothetical protein